jgi:ataxia telangiectasia mutated family protein
MVSHAKLACWAVPSLPSSVVLSATWSIDLSTLTTSDVCHTRPDPPFTNAMTVRLGATQPERLQALKEIKSLAKTYGARQANVPRKEWNDLLADLTRIASNEKATYLKQSKGLVVAVQRLTACSEALRHVAEASAGTIRGRSVNLLIDHITSMLPSTHGIFDNVSHEYIKTLRAILEYQPHVEHLRKPIWIQVMTFCVQRLRAFQEGPLDDSDGRTVLASRSASRLNRAAAMKGQSNQTSEPHNEGSELVLCLRHLCRAPNAPILEHAYSTIDVLAEYLRKSSSTGRADIEALSAINSIVIRAISSNMRVVEHAVGKLLPQVAHLWLLRSATLRDEILIFLNISLAHITKTLRNDAVPETRESVERIFDVLREDYSTRLVRDQLRLDDLELGLRSESSSEPCHPDVYGFRLAPGNIDGESKWMTMYAMSAFASILDETAAMQPHEQVDDAPRKRRRISTHLETLLSAPWTGVVSEQLCRLQTLTFLVTMRVLSIDQYRAVTDSVIGVLAKSNHDISSWAMLLLAK